MATAAPLIAKRREIYAVVQVDVHVSTGRQLVATGRGVLRGQDLLVTVRGRGRVFSVARQCRGAAHAVVRMNADVSGRRVDGLRVDERGCGAYGHRGHGRQTVGWRFLRHCKRRGRETQTGPGPEAQRHVASGFAGRAATAAPAAVQQPNGTGHHQGASEPHARLQRVAQRVVPAPVNPGPRATVVFLRPRLFGRGGRVTGRHHLGAHAGHVHLGARGRAQPLVQRVTGQVHEARGRGGVTSVPVFGARRRSRRRSRHRGR